MSERIKWNEIEPFRLSYALWQTTYKPNTWAKLVYKENQALYIHMFVEEKNPRATYKNNNEPVYKDSCLEAFINFNPNYTMNYLNIEVNALGTMCIQIGDKRKPRINLTPNFGPIPYQTENGWGFIMEIPWTFIVELFGEISSEWKANFYKCGDDCEEMHFLSWNKIELDTPNFHCPEYFGTINLK